METITPRAGFHLVGPGPCRPGRGLVLSLLFLVGAVGAAAQAGTVAEYRLKAVFLFNFAQFVDWLPEDFPSPAAPLVIGVLGDDPFGPFLDEAVRGEKVGTRPLVVRRFKRTDDFTSCQILFLSHSEDANFEQTIARLKGRRVLTVSDSEGAARRGVMIRFFTENRKIRLRINLDAARLARLTISSKLLRPAEIVTGEDN